MITKVQKNLEKFIVENGLKGPFIAAVSGGADSVCLLLVLKELQTSMGFELEAMHVEHGIRGEESLKDAAFVEHLCQRLSVPCHVEHVDVPAYSKERGIGTEEAARILRYEALSAYAKARKGQIVLAHHMEDNAETILFQMLRGSSLNGMCGIRPVRIDEDGVVYVRPLLDIRRSEIETYLKAAQQDFCVDSTNSNTEYHRNYLRKEIVPRLSEINTQAVPHITKTAQQLGEVRDFLQTEAKKAVKRLVRTEEYRASIRIEDLKELHPAMQKELLYDMFAHVAGSRKDIASVHVEGVWGLMSLQSGRTVTLPYGVVARRDFDTLVIEKWGFVSAESQKSAGDRNRTEDLKETETIRTIISDTDLAGWKEDALPVEVQLPGPGEKMIFRIFSYNGNSEEIPKKPYTKWFDYDKIKQGFCIRTRENGDFLINDAKGHRKKLKAYFIDEKISTEERSTMRLLAQDSLVLWVVGGRISEHVKVSQETETVMEIQYIGGK